ncbi:LPS-assembly protein LptD [Thalassoglobus polymorphus]|uniref:LPS-assembly protein LptD n=2 Tax=Thalassoglobus polymorphus TaxID=2527994 RepID=A0A517QRJ2_9PLAN|nr:LPS-assembly protein LptD [Thalassoglobus polymorphus]
MLCCWLSISGSLSAQTAPAGHSLGSQPSTDSGVQQIGTSNPLLEPIEIQVSIASQIPSDKEKILLLRGPCKITKGAQSWSSPQAVIWQIQNASGKGGRIIAYLDHTPEVSPVMQEQGHRETRPYFFLELETDVSIAYSGPVPVSVPGAKNDPVYLRAVEHRKKSTGSIQQVQNTTLAQAQSGPALPMLGSPYRRRVTIGPRFLGERFQAKADFIESSVQPEYVITVTGGVNIVIDNVPLTINGQTFLTRIDLSADRAVVWTDADRIGDLEGFEIDENTPFEVFLEGDIVVRQGASKIKASRAFYDISQRRGLLVDAEIRTQVPEYDGSIRLRAAEVRQFSAMNFHARNAYFTTSEFGQPKYRIESSDIFLEERPSIFPNAIDPATGLPDPSTLWITSHNNRLFIENVPVFNSPYLTGPAEDPRIPITELNFGYSGVFGAELETAWNLEGLLGLELPEGTDLNLEVDYFSERGPAAGLQSEYDSYATLFGAPAHHSGMSHFYYIHDSGVDNLGLGRRSLAPPNENRGRILWRNETELTPFTSIFAEVGHVFNNDRNFQEQWYEEEWDRDKDLENKISLEHQYDNLTTSITGAIRSNDFANQTDWLPRADITLLGQPVFNSPINWSMHSAVGYGRLHQASPPPDPVADPFVPLDYFADSEGLVAHSRHELTLPFNAGPVKVVPYALGEVAHWQEDLTGQDLTRWYGSAGVRASLQFAKYMPHVQSSILGLNGLAHKVTYDLDYYFAEASEDLDRIPQYNAFDENAQERFRSRFQVLEFGGVLPDVYDPRLYAVRSGAGRSVTAPYNELVDDQHALRLGMRHRWQTKVGPPENPRIVDWMELDLGLTYFPDAEEDNFGEDFGLLTSRYAWHVGPRTSVLASGAFDFFDMGQRVWNVGLLSQRSERGSIYFGYRNLEAGPVESQLLTSSVSYVMTPNLYVATFGASYDIAEGIDRGQSLTVTRISENFLLHFGLGYDRSKDNVGVALSLEPKFGSFGRGSMQLNSLLGID